MDHPYRRGSPGSILEEREEEHTNEAKGYEMVWAAIAAKEECKSDTMSMCHIKGIVGVVADIHLMCEFGSDLGSPSAPGLDHG